MIYERIDESQSKYYKAYKDIEKQCQDLAKIVKRALFDELPINISKQMVMKINSTIYSLSEEWSKECQINFDWFQEEEPDYGIENKLLYLYTKCLKEFVSEIYYQLDQDQYEFSVLKQAVQHYHNYKAFSYWLYKIFYHLDASQASSVIADLHSISLDTLRDGYFMPGMDKLLNTILIIIMESRYYGQFTDKSIKSLCELFVVMGSKTVKLIYHKESQIYDYICLNFQETENFYKANYEKRFLEETKKYYREAIQMNYPELGQKMTIVEFLQWSEKVFNLEEAMCKDSYPKSYDQLKELLIELFVTPLAEKLSNDGVLYFLSDNHFDYLGKLYNLISKNESCVKYIAQQFQYFYYHQAKDVNKVYENEKRTPEMAENYCNTLLELMEKAENIIKGWMKSDKQIYEAYYLAFQSAFNEFNDSPKCLAIFSDKHIRTEKGINEIETDRKLTKIVTLFQLLYEKDKFLQQHRKLLQSRLLNPLSQRCNVEKSLLQKIRGISYDRQIFKLQNMISDIELSQRFAIDQNINQNQSFEFQVYLLNQGLWKFDSNQSQVIAPQIIKNSLDQYSEIYQNKNNGRIVEWNLAYGQGEVTYKINSEKYYISLNSLQIVTFLLFNNNKQLTIEQLLTETQIKQFDLENSLIPFIHYKILSRQNQDLYDFNDKDELIKLNYNFKNNAKKMKLLPNPKLQPRRQIQDRTYEQISEDRAWEEQIIKQRESVIDTQLVRIMKIKKTIEHKDLVNQCQEMVKIFKPDQTFIKKRIECLINGEFIKRDDKHVDLYHYRN